MRNLVAIKSLGKHYDSKYKFYYMSCREFAEYKKNKDVSIIGYTDLKRVPDKKQNTIDTYLVTKTENPDYFRIRSSRNCTVIRRYIHVGDNQFASNAITGDAGKSSTGNVSFTGLTAGSWKGNAKFVIALNTTP